MGSLSACLLFNCHPGLVPGSIFPAPLDPALQRDQSGAEVIGQAECREQPDHFRAAQVYKIRVSTPV